MAKAKAKNKSTRISAKQVVNAIGVQNLSIREITIGEGDEALNVSVVPFLSFAQQVSFINDVIDMCFTDNDDGTENYAPEFEQFALEYNVVAYFTNIELPKDVEDMWHFLHTTSVASVVWDVLSPAVQNEIRNAVRQGIDHRKERIAKTTKFDKIIESLGGVMTAIKAKTENMDFNELMEKLSTAVPEFKDDIHKLINTGIADSVAEE